MSTLQNRIHIFTNGVSRKNGGSSSILDLSNTLIEIGYDVEIYTPFGFMDKYIYKPTNVNNELNINILDCNIFNQKNKSKVKKYLNKILNFFPISKVKNIKNSIVIDAMGLPFEFLQLLQENNCKIILNHAGSANAYIKYFGLNGAKRTDLENAKYEYLDMISNYDHILFQSATQAQTLKDLAEWDIDKTLVLKPSASEDDIVKIKGKKSILDNNDFNIVIIGSVQMRKGQHLLPTISEKLSQKVDNIKFHIVGNIVDEKYKNSIIQLSETLHQQNQVIFHGFKENYLDYMNSADVILQVSEEEGVSRILREAMALEKVIISFQLDGTNDLLVNREDSLLSEYGELNQLTDNILKVYKDNSLYEKLSSSALQNFEDKYSMKEYQKQLKILMEKIGGLDVNQ